MQAAGSPAALGGEGRVTLEGSRSSAEPSPPHPASASRLEQVNGGMRGGALLSPVNPKRRYLFLRLSPARKASTTATALQHTVTAQTPVRPRTWALSAPLSAGTHQGGGWNPQGRQHRCRTVLVGMETPLRGVGWGDK